MSTPRQAPSTRIPLSILDLAPIGPGETARDSFAASTLLARTAEAVGYRRIWYAEHHNMPSIASSATSVLIGHIAARTSTIRVGAGGVMLPNHAPLTIAEQFGTLATLYPDRIDLGLGRAPGTDQNTLRALRRTPASADGFPQDVLELQAYLRDESRVPGVRAVPGAGTDVPLFILGSSLFGAQLAAALGLPYAFASHFAPDALHSAIRVYREKFTPSAQLELPYVIAGVNVVAAEDSDDAVRQFHTTRRRRVRGMLSRGGAPAELTDEQVDAFLATPEGRGLAAMTRYSAVGRAEQVRDYLVDFATTSDVDELMVVHQSPTPEGRLRSAEFTADAMRSGT